MFGRLFKKQKDQYFFAMLAECVGRANGNPDAYTLEEFTSLLFPKKERDINVDAALKQKYPLNAAAMSYYASCMKLRFEDSSLDDDQYSNMMLAQLDYLAACRRWDILRSIANDMVVEEFKNDYLEKINEAEAAE